MTIRYNPNGGYKGTGGWYVDEPVISVIEKVEDDNNLRISTGVLAFIVLSLLIMLSLL